MKNYTDALLSLDPLDVAEQLTGQSYKTDDTTNLIGMSIALNHARTKEEHLLSLDDTVLSNDLERYKRIV